MIEGLKSIARQRAEEAVSALLVENALNSSEIASAFLKDEPCCGGDHSQLDSIIEKIPEDSDDENRVNMVLNATSDISAGDLLAAGVTQESADSKEDKDEPDDDSEKEKSDDESESKEDDSDDDDTVEESAKDFDDLFGDD